MVRRLWTENGFIVVFNLYLKLPFGKMDSRTEDVIKMANLIGRTPSAIAMRLVNFASVDPFHQKRGIKGREGGKKQCKPIFDKFINERKELMFQSETILAEMEGNTVEKKYNKVLFDLSNYKGKTRETIVKTRVNQQLFREIILASYNTKCAISEIDIPTLLVASHIIPWSNDENNRLNPSNGICLNNLYDKAFDRGLIGINSSYEILLSDRLKKEHKKEYFKSNFETAEGKKLTLPDRFVPDIDFFGSSFGILF